MLYLKQRLLALYDLYFINRGKKISNDIHIKKLMHFFKADEYGHQAVIDKADLGFGWLHYGLVRTLKPRSILCVGSRHGFIPAVLAQACKDNAVGHVYFVDAGFDGDDKENWSGVGYWKTQAGRNSFAEYGLNKWISLFVMTTKQFQRKYKEMTYDYIYIDGDHSYNGVKLDFSLFWPALSHKGLLSFHDISVKEVMDEGEYGVHKFWDEIKRKQSTAFDIPFLGSGLGIIQKN